MTSEEIVALAANVAFCGCACCEEVSSPLLDEVARLRTDLARLNAVQERCPLEHAQ